MPPKRRVADPVQSAPPKELAKSPSAPNLLTRKSSSAGKIAKKQQICHECRKPCVDDWDGDRFDEKMTLCKNCTFVCDCGFLTRFTRSASCVPCSIPPKCEACWQDPGSLGCECEQSPRFDAKGDPLPRSSAKKARKDPPPEPKAKASKAAKTESSASGSGALAGKAICFTGALSMVRREAEALAAAHGAIIRKGVSGNTDIVVLGPGAGSKKTAAKIHRVTIWNENEFRKAVGLPPL